MKKVLRLVAVMSGMLFGSVNRVLALGGLDTTAGQAGFKEKDPLKIGGAALNVILSFIGALFLIMMLVGGFLWMTAAGNEKKADTAKSLIVAAVIGLLIVAGAYALTAWLGDTLSIGL